jgi:hypothetical protein
MKRRGRWRLLEEAEASGRELVETRHAFKLDDGHLELVLVGALECAQKVRVFHLVSFFLGQLTLEYNQYLKESRKADHFAFIVNLFLVKLDSN